VEIGGTVGDIESMAFIEAIRQFARHVGRAQTCFMHLTYAPYLAVVGETKTKPTQNAVRALLEMGIQADVVVVRSDTELPAAEREKIALFAGLPTSHVVSCPDSDTIYRVPVTVHAQGLDAAILDHFGLTAPTPDLSRWQSIADIHAQPPRTVTIGVVGKYTQLGDSYKSLNEALTHGGFAHWCKVNIEFIDSEALETLTDAELATRLNVADGLLIPGGFGARGTEGKIRAITYARTHKVPLLGICLGLQLAIIEAARNLAGLAGANSTEFTPEKGTPLHPLICLMSEWGTASGKQQGTDKTLGGTMRLGAYPAALTPGSLAASLYGSTSITERHRHRYEFNPAYKAQLEKAGLVFSGVSPTDAMLAEVVELPQAMHPYFIAVQYHPEFKSQPLAPHPLFAGLVAAALATTTLV
jgi:CTP synthase